MIVVFPMMITSSELDDGSIQILRDSIDELLLCVIPLLHVNSINHHRDNIDTWSTKRKTYSFSDYQSGDLPNLCILKPPYVSRLFIAYG